MSSATTQLTADARGSRVGMKTGSSQQLDQFHREGYADLFRGIDYEKGRNGVSQNFVAAKKCYETAAQYNIPEAQLLLGLLYWDGQGVAQNRREAIKWLRKSANQQNLQAMRWIGLAYKEGAGVPQSYEEAKSWWRKAALLGDEKSLDELEELNNLHRSICCCVVQ